MDLSFHYHCIRVLAHGAGFSPTEAETIAYASQYVDDATEHKPIFIRDAPEEAAEQHIAGRFEPVCSAHTGVQYLSYGSKDIQRKVYIAFHFVPDQANHQGPYDYRVKPGGKLASTILDLAVHELLHATTGHGRSRALIKLGIALHSFADTWAHQGFSGRHHSSDNDIQQRARFENGAWHEVGLFERAAMDMLPDIGHAEAGTMPDTCYLQWRYVHAASGRLVKRNNPEIFHKAATAIWRRLCAATGSRNSIPKAILNCLASHEQPTIWTRSFPEVFSSSYDKHDWRRSCLTTGRVDWERFQSPEEFASQIYDYAGDPKWLLFHAEAGKQRDFVLRSIRYDLA